jgi:hypothetical protein
LDDYLTLLRESGQAIKAGNPNAFILDSGMGGSQYGVPISNTYYQQGDVTGGLVFLQLFNQNYTVMTNPPHDDASLAQ